MTSPDYGMAGRDLAATADKGNPIGTGAKPYRVS